MKRKLIVALDLYNGFTIPDAKAREYVDYIIQQCQEYDEDPLVITIGSDYILNEIRLAIVLKKLDYQKTFFHTSYQEEPILGDECAIIPFPTEYWEKHSINKILKELISAQCKVRDRKETEE